jgi:HPt (histidine-containing phosphotransfer) domain-containing protein
VSYHDTDLVDWPEFNRMKAELGKGFLRILGYFREDGDKSITAVETAFRARNATALIIPAHRLKGESAQFGAHRLSSMAEDIEMVARRCVEARESPEELIEVVVVLRPCFTETMALLDRDASPLAPRRSAATFGRRAEPHTHGFGRAG